MILHNYHEIYNIHIKSLLKNLILKINFSKKQQKYCLFKKNIDTMSTPKKIRRKTMLKRIALVFVFTGIATATYAGPPTTGPSKPPDPEQLDCLIRCLTEEIPADKCKRICI